MTLRISLLILLCLAVVAGAGHRGGALAQGAPIAGSGKLPEIDPYAEAPHDVVEAIANLLSNRTEGNPFNGIKACFKDAGGNEITQIDCRQRLDRYFSDMMEKHREKLGRFSRLEVYARLTDLSGDPSGKSFVRDVYALRGVVVGLDDARRFRDVKICFQDAGPQPAIRQICRQQLYRYHTELLRENFVLFRDINPKLIHKRLFAIADQDNAIFGVGEMTAIESMRNIRKAQQEEKQSAARAMSQAQRYYCPPSTSRRLEPLEVQMASDGICLCSYGRRFLGSTPTVRGRPVGAIYSSCGATSRFRILDLNRGHLMHGDWITIQAAHGGYVGVHENGFLYANRPTAGKYEQFRIVRPSGLPGQIRPGEMITLMSPRGVFVSTNLSGGGALRGVKEKPKPHDFFVLVR